jgi:hypothetical protein
VSVWRIEPRKPPRVGPQGVRRGKGSPAQDGSNFPAALLAASSSAQPSGERPNMKQHDIASDDRREAPGRWAPPPVNWTSASSETLLIYVQGHISC